MRRAQVLALGLALAAPAAAHDVPFPEFPDPNEACAVMPNDYSRNDCLRRNQLGYDQAHQVWDRVSPMTIKVCVRPYTGPLAYYALGKCVSDMYWSYDHPREPAPPFHRD